MKRYEDYNKRFDRNDSAEEHAVGMVLAQLAMDYELDIVIADYKNNFSKFLIWLKEDIENDR